MKKIVILVFASIIMSFAFSQSDFQVIAEVNLTKREPITVGELKLFVKNLEATAGQKTTVEQRKEILASLIDNKLVLQLAQKNGTKIPDSRVNEYFQYMLSSMVGQPITENQFESVVKNKGYASFDAFMKEQTGMTVSRYKEFLRDQLTSQNYIMSAYANELQKIDASSAEVEQAYDANKQDFVRPDMLTAFMVTVEKKGQTSSEKAKIDALRARLLSNTKATDQIGKESQKENAGYTALNLYMYKNEQTAQSLGITMSELMQIFNLNVNTVTEVKEMPTNFQFFVIVSKEKMKFLGLNDKIDPAQDVTVRQLLHNNIKLQKQNAAFAEATKKTVDSVKNDKNYKISKTDAELNKLLAW